MPRTKSTKSVNRKAKETVKITKKKPAPAKKVVKKKVEKVVEKPVEESKNEEETTTTTATPEQPKKEEYSTSDFLKEIADQATEVSRIMRNIATNIRKARRQHDKELKAALKQKGGRRKRDPNKKPRPPSGFAKPGPITSELAEFLGEEAGVELARTEVTRRITRYIKENDLQNPEAKREIIPDDDLRALLRLPEDETLTFFNLQKYMKIHFPKKQKPEESSK